MSTIRLEQRLIGLDKPDDCKKLMRLLEKKIRETQSVPTMNERYEDIVTSLKSCELEGLKKYIDAHYSDKYKEDVESIASFGIQKENTVIVFYPPDGQTYKAIVKCIYTNTVKIEWLDGNTIDTIPINWITGVFK